MRAMGMLDTKGTTKSQMIIAILSIFAGFFCPNETRYANMFPCPSGTFGNETGQTNATGCHPCPAMFYCGGRGLQDPTGYCDAGEEKSSLYSTLFPRSDDFILLIRVMRCLKLLFHLT
jgi:hypothetical protein